MSLMDDKRLTNELYNRFHATSAEIFSDRIKNLLMNDLPFENPDGSPFGAVKHLVRGEDKSGATFDIYRLGWFGGRVWELVIIDGVYLPHIHKKIDSEFFIFKGRGHLSRNDEWSAYEERFNVPVGQNVAHGFITDPQFGPTIFLSIQSEPIRKISINPVTQKEEWEDDFEYVNDRFPLDPVLLEGRNHKLAALERV